MSSPSLIINRLIVIGELSCDYKFDRGLNVIHSDSTDPLATNNAGKSTLIELIQHGLGKRHESKAKWYLNSIVDKVGKMYLEVSLNGKVFTIERSLQNITASVTIRHTSYTSNIDNVDGPKIAVEDMSDWFLANLGIPIVSVSTAGGKLEPLAFSLLMRAFVLNQLLSFNSILNKVIPEQRIADVIGFLTGIIPLERFILEKEVSEKRQEMQELSVYFDSVKKFLAENTDFSAADIASRLVQLEKDLEQAKDEQISIQTSINKDVGNIEYRTGSGRIDVLKRQLLSVKEEISSVEYNLSGLEQEQKRLLSLVESLKTDQQKIRRLNASSMILSSVEFDACPRCLQPITSEMRSREEHGRCCLCSRLLTVNSDLIPIAVPQTEDIDMQVEEVETVLKDISGERKELEARLERLASKEQDIGRTLDTATRNFVAPAIDRLLEQAHQIALYEAELARIRMLDKQVHSMDIIRIDLDKKKLELASLEERLKFARRANKETLEKFRQTFERILKEVGLPDLRDCIIDAKKLMPFINNNLYSNLGAAYTSLIVICYHLSLLEFSRANDTFFPSLLVIDSPQVYDRNEASENNLLRYFVKLATEGPLSEDENWQIILTTRRKIDGLDRFIKATISGAENQKLLRRSNTEG